MAVRRDAPAAASAPAKQGSKKSRLQAEGLLLLQHTSPVFDETLG